MTKEELGELVKSLATSDDAFSHAPALWKALLKLNERVEELEQAIRSFTSEEGDDLAESLYLTLPAYGQHEWTDGLVEHRQRIEKLRALIPPHRIG
jgi:hypothetical protein